jgi:hypothetical protein
VDWTALQEWYNRSIHRNPANFTGQSTSCKKSDPLCFPEGASQSLSHNSKPPLEWTISICPADSASFIGFPTFIIGANHDSTRLRKRIAAMKGLPPGRETKKRRVLTNALGSIHASQCEANEISRNDLQYKTHIDQRNPAFQVIVTDLRQE